MAGWPKLPMMDPNSEAEILPSPMTSNFLKTCSSSAIWIGVSSDPEFVFEFVFVVVVIVVVVDELRESVGGIGFLFTVEKGFETHDFFFLFLLFLFRVREKYI